MLFGCWRLLVLRLLFSVVVFVCVFACAMCVISLSSSSKITAGGKTDLKQSKRKRAERRKDWGGKAEPKTKMKKDANCIIEQTYHRLKSFQGWIPLEWEIDTYSYSFIRSIHLFIFWCAQEMEGIYLNHHSSSAVKHDGRLCFL